MGAEHQIEPGARRAWYMSIFVASLVALALSLAAFAWWDLKGPGTLVHFLESVRAAAPVGMRQAEVVQRINSNRYLQIVGMPERIWPYVTVKPRYGLRTPLLPRIWQRVWLMHPIPASKALMDSVVVPINSRGVVVEDSGNL